MTKTREQLFYEWFHGMFGNIMPTPETDVYTCWRAGYEAAQQNYETAKQNYEAARQTNLFQLGAFTLHAGEHSNYKIDCDALTDADIETCALLISKRALSFSDVEGVPTGGTRLANSLQKYRIGDPGTGRLLIVDDVMTTGQSMQSHRQARQASGFVIFKRLPVVTTTDLRWVRSLFTMLDS